MKCQNRVGLVLFHPLWIGKFIRYKYVLSSSVLQTMGENSKVSLELSRVLSGSPVLLWYKGLNGVSYELVNE